jgi:hypothetical protein
LVENLIIIIVCAPDVAAHVWDLIKFSKDLAQKNDFKKKNKNSMCHSCSLLNNS